METESNDGEYIEELKIQLEDLVDGLDDLEEEGAELQEKITALTSNGQTINNSPERIDAEKQLFNNMVAIHSNLGRQIELRKKIWPDLFGEKTDETGFVM